MIKKSFLIVLGVLVINGCSSIGKKKNTGIRQEKNKEQYVSAVWKSDQGDGSMGQPFKA